MTGVEDLVDEVGPVVGPVLLQDGDQDQVEFVHKGAFRSELFFGAGVFDDETNDEIPDHWARD